MFLIDCMPYSKEACRDVAAKYLGWTMETGDYGIKGCYVYEEGSPHHGKVWNGTGGSYQDKTIWHGLIRAKGFDCYRGNLSVFHDSLLIRL